MPVKYITFKGNEGNNYAMFSHDIEHKIMAFRLRLLPDDIIGAGFCTIHNNTIEPYGESESLKVRMSSDDKQILNKEFHN